MTPTRSRATPPKSKRDCAPNDDPGAMASWARALRGLQRHPGIWRDRIDPAVIARLIALASGRDDAPEQLRQEVT